MVTSRQNWAQLIKHATELGRCLKQHQQTLATAESCTGGGIGYAITEVAGSSAWFNGGLITYTNELKQQLLGVSETVLKHHGAVSEACVRAMAAGARHQTQADWSIAVSGVAGPAGGSAEKPVGLVWMAIMNDTECDTFSEVFSGDREAVRLQTIETVITRLIKKLS